MHDWNRRAITFGGLGLLALVVAVLAIFALLRPSAGGIESSLSSAPAVQTTSGVPSPTKSAAAFQAAASGRLLTSSEGTLWRASTGSCIEGVEPLVERSDDSGASWTPISFGANDVRQVTWIGGFADGQLEVIADSGESCNEIGLRTFTRGEFWAVNDALLANATRLTSAGAITSPQGDGTAPCEGVYDVHGDSQIAVGLCSGEAFVRDADGWSSTKLSQAVATTVADSVGYIMSATETCAGLAVATVAGGEIQPALCAEGLDGRAATALTLSQGQLFVWNGEEVRVFSL